MNLDPKQLIDGYLDETLSADEQAVLNHWLKESPQNAQQFAQEMLLHDRLRGEHLALDAVPEISRRALARVRAVAMPSDQFLGPDRDALPPTRSEGECSKTH